MKLRINCFKNCSQLQVYYLKGLPSFLILYIFLLLLDVRLINILFFSVAWFWHMYLIAPGAKQKAQSSRYRYSFVRLVFLLDDSFQKRLNAACSIGRARFIRALSPFLFVLILYLIALNGLIFFSILGSGLFEVNLFVMDRLFNRLLGSE